MNHGATAPSGGFLHAFFELLLNAFGGRTKKPAAPFPRKQETRRRRRPF